MVKISTIGHAYVELRGITNRLERDIERALDPAVKRLGNTISENISDSIRTGFSDVDASELQLDVGQAGDEAGRRLKEQIQDNLRDDLRLNVSVDIDKAADDVDLLLAYIREKINSADLRIDNIRLDEEAFKVDPSINEEAMRAARSRMEDLKEEYKEIAASIHPDTNAVSAAGTNARLAWLTRPRTVSIFPTINQGAMAGVVSALTALSGIRMTTNVLDSMWNMVNRLDESIPKITLMGSAVTYLGAFITSLVSDVSHLVVELGSLAGLLIPMPGILAGFGVGMATLVIAMQDAGTQLESVKDDFTALGETIKSNFWAEAQGPILDFVNSVLPTLRDGMGDTATALGEQFASLAEELERAFGDGSLATMFSNLNASIREASRYTEEYADIIAILGRHGSEYLPRLATWFGEISTRFRDFLAEAENSGELQRWTEQAIENLGHLGSAVYGLGRIFYELGDIAGEAGAATLEGLAGALNGIADIIGREPFRSRLLSVFTEAHNALLMIADIAGPAVTDFFENFALLVSTTFRTLAPAIGTAIKNIAEALSGSAFTRGFMDFVGGIGDGVRELSEAFVPMGEALGSIGTIIGEMAREFGPILAEVLTTVSTLVIGLEEPILGVVGFLTDLMDTFTDLPAYVQVGVAGLLAFSGPLKNLFTMVGSNALSRFHFDLDMAAAKAQVAGTQVSTLGRAATIAGASVRFLGNMLKAALITSGVGIAIAAVTTAIGYFVTKSSEAKQTTQDLADTIDGLTRSFTEASTEFMVDDLFTKLENVDLAGLRHMGVDIGEGVLALQEGAPAAREYVAGLEELIDAKGRELRQLAGTGRDEEVRMRQGEKAALEEYRNEINNYIPVAQEAMEIASIRADAEATATQQYRDAQAAEEQAKVATDARNSAIESQVTSLSDLLNIQREINGEVRSAAEAEASLEEAYARAESAIKNTTDAVKDNGAAIDLSSEQGRKNQDALFGVADAALAQVDAMDAAGASNEEMAAALDASRATFLEMADDAGLSSEAARQLADDLGLVEGTRLAEILADTSQAHQKVGEFLLSVDKADPSAIKINGDSVPAETTLGDLINGIGSTETEVQIGGNTLPADMTLEEYARNIPGMYPADLRIGADMWAAEENVTEFRAGISATPSPLLIGADLGSAVTEVDTFRNNLPASPADVPVGADMYAAEQGVEGLRTDAATKPAQLGVNVDKVQAAGQVNTVRESVAATPANLSIVPLTEGLAGQVQGAVSGLAATVAINGDPTNANVTLAILRGAIANTNASVRISANTSPANGELSSIIRSVLGTTAVMRIDAQSILAERTLTRFIRQVIGTTSQMKIGANTLDAFRTLRTLTSAINNTGGTVDVLANTSLATGAVNDFITRTNNRSATVTVRTRQISENANGGLYPTMQAFARGGIRRGENHVAQIARGGVTRIWAEPETGGEAYIPLAMSKRLRSLRILEQVAKIMGHSLVPMQGKSVKAFANGGVLTRRDVSLLSRKTVNDGNIGNRAGQTTVATQGPAQPIQITNNFTINNANDLDVHTLAKEVSRQIMFKSI